MDFAVCPSCGQSVLDDDAADCPFCGASMKAKPGAKPAGGAKPAAPAAKPTGPAAKPGAKPAGKPDPKAAADDFPFDADMLQASDAIAAAPTAGKGRPLQVVCPMCETAGFVPSSAAGKMVKCANPKCMVPLFKAPAPEAPKAAPPPPKPKNNLVTMGIITAAVVAVLGGGAYLFVTMSGGSAPVTKPLTPEDVARMKAEADKRKQAAGGGVAKVEPDQQDGNVPSVTPGAEVVNVAKTAEFRATLLKSMSELSLLSGNHNRSKPLCRRLTAEAYALSGQIKEARDQIGALSTVGRDVPFYRVIPWVEVAWAEQAVKNDSAVKTALDSALSESASLPKFGRDRLVAATYVAAALAGANRHADARTALTDRQADDLDGNLAFVICWLEFDQNLTEMEPLYELMPIVPRAETQTAATTAVLVLRGQSKAALAFAKATPAGEARRDALAGWVEARAWQNPAMAPTEIEPELTELSPAHQAYVWARAARAAANRKGTEAAKAFIAKAVAVLEMQPVPTEFEIPPLKQLMKWKPTPAGELLAMATAVGEVALAQHAIADNTAAAASLERMLSITRAIGPSKPQAVQLQKELDGIGLNAMRDRLKKDLDIRKDDDARQALNIYRQVLNDLNAGATTRFDFQTRALSRAAQAGLEKAVWEIVSKRTAAEELAQQEPYFSSSIPSWLFYRFERTQATDDLNALVAAHGQFVSTKLAPPPIAIAIDHFLAGRTTEGIALLSHPSLKGDPRELIAIRGMMALLHRGDIEAAWGLLSKQEMVFREQADQWAALTLTRQGKAGEAWKRTEALNGATEKVSIARGIIGGLRDKK